MNVCPACERPYREHTATWREAVESTDPRLSEDGGGRSRTLTLETSCPIPPTYEVVLLADRLTIHLPVEERWEIVGEPHTVTVMPGGDHYDPLAEDLVVGVKVQVRRRID